MTSTFRLWPHGFTGRVTLVLLFAVIVQFIAGSLLAGADEVDIQRQDLGRRLAEQLLVAEQVIKAAEPAEQARLLATLSTHHVEFALVEGPPPVATSVDPAAADILSSIVAWEPSLAQHSMQLTVASSSGLELRRNLEGALSLGGDRWIVFRTLEPIAGWVAALGISLRVGVIALIVLGTAGLLVRTMSAPLRQLSNNAQMIGTSRIQFEETAGPRELREVSRALNTMQDRIEGLIAQRTHALVAVGHDLRTPLARLRLRVPAITDEDDREAAQRDIAEMSRMLQELLDYFDVGESGREAGPVDIASLSFAVAEEFSDLGASVTYEGPERLIVPAFYDPLRRAISNLVDNSVKYGGAARLSLAEHPDGVELTVRDEGPGISPEELDRVRLPFERLDAARGAMQPGIGLGLSIAQRAADQHGGTLVLRNRRPHGLAATLILPAD